MGDIFNGVFGDVFGDMFGGRRGSQQRSGPARGAGDLRHDLEITLEQAYASAEVEITRPAALTCETCTGSGAKPGTSPTACPAPAAAGAGCAPPRAFSPSNAPAPAAAARAVWCSDPCADCHGMGQVRRERTLSVRIPAGVDDGARIRLAGEGDGGSRGGPRGDLYIFLSVRPHELFERDGLDLLCTGARCRWPWPRSAARSKPPA